MAKILIVDDDPDFQNATRIVLEKEGHTIFSAKSGNEGYRRAKEDQPDLIVLDVMMDSVLDGLSMSRQMYEDDEMRDIPIIMVTSIANTDYAELFPTDDYIHIRAFMSKPIDPAKLIKQVNKLLVK
ncbi:MAG: response regulator [Anaerolineales bacterium]|nr:response regulator [Chloroflexota bacterium]MBL7161247.1 response regulator [Anaerolineales bacterium]